LVVDVSGCARTPRTLSSFDMPGPYGGSSAPLVPV
jgi:hypothetical protein